MARQAHARAIKKRLGREKSGSPLALACLHFKITVALVVCLFLFAIINHLLGPKVRKASVEIEEN